MHVLHLKYKSNHQMIVRIFHFTDKCLRCVTKKVLQRQKIIYANLCTYTIVKFLSIGSAHSLQTRVFIEVFCQFIVYCSFFSTIRLSQIH